MAKFTLLQMTQLILNSMSSDEVNSISDTTESLQVANIIQAKYYDMVNRGDLPDDKQLFQLVASGDSTKPTLMTVPAGTSKIKWLKYFNVNPADGQQTDQFGAFSHGLNLDLSSATNSGWVTSSVTSNTIGTGTFTFTVGAGLKIAVGDNVTASSGPNELLGVVLSYSGTTLVLTISMSVGSGTFNSWAITNTQGTAPPGYQYVRMTGISEFLDYVNRFTASDANVRSFTFTESGENFTFFYKNNIQPQYATIISNQYVIFDSFNSVFDTTLQSSKTMCFGNVVPAFTLTDSFIPALDDNQFSLLINEAKALAFFELKQMPHAKAEQEIKRQWSAVQKNKSISNKPTYFDQLPSFGRMPRTGGYGGFNYGPKLWN